METLERILGEHPFFAKLDADFLALVTGCAANVRFRAGEYVYREGESADNFYILRHGIVDLELHAPGRGEMLLIASVRQGQVLGESWLFPPYRWHFDARARSVVRAISLDGVCLRGKCEDNPAMGYEMMKRFSAVFAERLQATRLQLLDLYGT